MAEPDPNNVSNQAARGHGGDWRVVQNLQKLLPPVLLQGLIGAWSPLHRKLG